MKQIVNNWVYGLIFVGLIAAGCSGFRISRDIVPAEWQGLDSYNQGLVRFQPGEELWILERNSNVAYAIPASPDSRGLRALVKGRETPLPLTHMDVHATVNGYIGAVDVRQQFVNPYAQNIEAVYAFPLPPDAAVDGFIMTIGKRRIRGIIRERKEAEAIYEEAKRQGYLASLLSADRANTFRQSIANIEPGDSIDVRIHYFQTLDFIDGQYEFAFPFRPEAKSVSGKAADSRATPDISLQVDVNGGAAIADLQSPTHAIVKKIISPEHWTAQLNPEGGFPDRDFRLRYRLAGSQSQADLITYRDERGGYFTLMLHSTNAFLTNIKIDWGSTQVSEIFPHDLTNLLPGHAVMFSGRFNGSGVTTIGVAGLVENQPVSFSIPVDFSKTSAEKAIPKIWASMKIFDLAKQSADAGNLDLLRETRQVALDYGLVSPFTAFLAVDASEAAGDGEIITVPVVP